MKIIYSLMIWTLCLGIFFVYLKSSKSKLAHPYAFSMVIKDYGFVTNDLLIRILTPLVIIAELFAGFWILIPETRQIGILIGICLQLFFIMQISINMGRTFKYGCGCFELNTPRTVTWKHIVFNVSLLFAYFLIVAIQTMVNK